MEQCVFYFRGGVSMLSLSKVNSQPICGVVVPYTLLWIQPPSVLSIPLFSGRFSFLILPHHGLSLPNLIFLQHSYLNKNLIIPFRNLGVIFDTFFYITPTSWPYTQPIFVSLSSIHFSLPPLPLPSFRFGFNGTADCG